MFNERMRAEFNPIIYFLDEAKFKGWEKGMKML